MNPVRFMSTKNHAKLTLEIVAVLGARELAHVVTRCDNSDGAIHAGVFEWAIFS